jgi:hypothetical protein
MLIVEATIAPADTEEASLFSNHPAREQQLLVQAFFDRLDLLDELPVSTDTEREIISLSARFAAHIEMHAMRKEEHANNEKWIEVDEREDQQVRQLLFAQMKDMMSRIDGVNVRALRGGENFLGKYLRELLSVAISKRNKRVLWKLKRRFDSGKASPMDVYNSLENMVRRVNPGLQAQWALQHEPRDVAGHRYIGFAWWDRYANLMRDRVQSPSEQYHVGRSDEQRKRDLAREYQGRRMARNEF